MQPPAAVAGGEIEVVGRASASSGWTACASRSRIAFGDDPDSPVTVRLARFALAAFDGAFVASQADPAVTLEELLEPLVPALVAARRALLAKAR